MKFWLGFGTCLGLMVLLGFSDQTDNRFNTEAEKNRAFYEIFRKLDAPAFEVRNTSPTIGELEKGQYVAVSNGAQTIFWRVEDQLFYVSGTRWQ